MPCEVKKKFPMHGKNLKKALRNVQMAGFLGLAASFCLYLLHNLPLMMKNKTFYSNYDPLDTFDRMKTGGCLTLLYEAG